MAFSATFQVRHLRSINLILISVFGKILYDYLFYLKFSFVLIDFSAFV